MSSGAGCSSAICRVYDDRRTNRSGRSTFSPGWVYPECMTTRPVESAQRVVTPEDVERAGRLIAGELRETPVLEAGELSRRVGGDVVMKAECLQLTGSFKVRGAFNKMAGLGDVELEAGMVAASAGNHA